MVILGIDPGYAIVGYGVISYRNNHFSVIDYGAITTDAKTPFNERLEIICRVCFVFVVLDWRVHMGYDTRL